MEVSQTVENFFGVEYTTSEQHVDARKSRFKRDNSDVCKLTSFFEMNVPFPSVDFLMSLSSGAEADKSVDCHNAFEIGVASEEPTIGSNFGNIKYKRKSRVTSLQAVSGKIKAGKRDVIVKSTLIFQRIRLTIEGKKNMKQYLEYELSTFLMSLFENGLIRKTQKSELYQNFTPLSSEPTIENFIYFVDGVICCTESVGLKAKHSIMFYISTYLMSRVIVRPGVSLFLTDTHKIPDFLR